MIPAAAIYFRNLQYESYPALIMRSILSVSHRTAITYISPPQIVADLASLTDAYNTYLHCIISEFRDDANEHILTLIPRGNLPPFIASPDYLAR